jgi:hypothetical protein
LPFAISFSTSISRSESSARIVSRSRADGVDARTRWSTFAAIVGEIERLADARGADPAHQLLDRRVLEQVAARAGEDRVDHVVVLVGDRQHEHAGQRRDRRDVPRRLDAAMPGMFRSITTTSGASSRTISSASCPAAPRRRSGRPVLEQVASPVRNRIVVVHDQDADVLQRPLVDCRRAHVLGVLVQRDRNGAAPPRKGIRERREPEVDRVPGTAPPVSAATPSP